MKPSVNSRARLASWGDMWKEVCNRVEKVMAQFGAIFERDSDMKDIEHKYMDKHKITHE